MLVFPYLCLFIFGIDFIIEAIKLIKGKETKIYISTLAFLCALGFYVSERGL